MSISGVISGGMVMEKPKKKEEQDERKVGSGLANSSLPPTYLRLSEEEVENLLDSYFMTKIIQPGYWRPLAKAICELQRGKDDSR